MENPSHFYTRSELTMSLAGAPDLPEAAKVCEKHFPDDQSIDSSDIYGLFVSVSSHTDSVLNGSLTVREFATRNVVTAAKGIEFFAAGKEDLDLSVAAAEALYQYLDWNTPFAKVSARESANRYRQAHSRLSSGQPALKDA